MPLARLAEYLTEKEGSIAGQSGVSVTAAKLKVEDLKVPIMTSHVPTSFDVIALT